MVDKLRRGLIALCAIGGLVGCWGAYGPSPLANLSRPTIEIPAVSVDGGGINKDSSKDAALPVLLPFNSKLYVTWREANATANQIRAAVYNSDDTSPTWSRVDGDAINGLNKAPLQHASAPRPVDFNSKFYLTWEESNGATSQIRVAVYNGNDGAPVWNFVDGNGVDGINYDVTKNANRPHPLSFNTKLYLTWQEDSGAANQIRVAVYNGNDGAPTWAFVDGNGVTGLNKDVTRSASRPRLASLSSKLYLCWAESNGTTTQTRVAVYNGNDGAPAWSFVDGNGVNGLNRDTAENSATPQLAEKSGKLYSVWPETNSGAAQLRAVVYNGDDSSPNWSEVDGGIALNIDDTKNALNQSLISDNSTLYVSWVEDNGTANQIRLAVYNGEDAFPIWYLLDGGGSSGLNADPNSPAQTPHFAGFNSKLYGTWAESNGSNTLIRVFSGSPP